MNALVSPIQEALKHLDDAGTQASAIGTLGELLYAVDVQSEHLNPEILNHLGCLLEVISRSMLYSAHLAREPLRKLDTTG